MATKTQEDMVNKIICPKCDGRGRWVGDVLMHYCWHCNGKGKLQHNPSTVEDQLLERIKRLELEVRRLERLLDHAHKRDVSVGKGYITLPIK